MRALNSIIKRNLLVYCRIKKMYSYIFIHHYYNLAIFPCDMNIDMVKDIIRYMTI